jgi:hypothetical protein
VSGDALLNKSGSSLVGEPKLTGGDQQRRNRRRYKSHDDHIIAIPMQHRQALNDSVTVSDLSTPIIDISAASAARRWPAGIALIPARITSMFVHCGDKSSACAAIMALSLLDAVDDSWTPVIFALPFCDVGFASSEAIPSQ